MEWQGGIEGDWEHLSSTDLKTSTKLGATSTSSRLSTVRTPDLKTSWTPQRNSTKTFATFSKMPPLLSTSSFWVWAAPSTTHTLKPFKELGLDSQRVKKLASKLHVHSVNFAAKLVHTRRAFPSTVINSHQEPVSGQACNPPDPQWIFLSCSRQMSFTVLGTKVAPFPYLMWGVVFTACVVFLFFSLESWTPYFETHLREHNSKRSTYHQWCALPTKRALITHSPYILPKYPPRDVIRSTACFRRRAHTLRFETYNRSSSPSCDMCDTDDVQDEQHIIFHWANPHVISLRRKYAFDPE